MMWLSVAFGLEIPPAYHGVYVEPATVESWFTDSPTADLRVAVTVDAQGARLDTGMDARELVVRAFEADEWIVSDDAITGRLQIVDGVAQMTLVSEARREGEVWVRFADRLPMIADRTIGSVAMGALLSSGFELQGQPWILFSDGESHQSIKHGFDIEDGSFGRHNNTVRVHGEDFLFAQEGDLLTFKQAAPPDGPGLDMELVPDGRMMVAQHLSIPPFKVLADRLNLRSGPSTSLGVLAVVEGDTWVRVWQRRADWLLVQDGPALGWAFGPYLGRRVEPLHCPDACRSHSLVDALSTGGVPIEIQNASPRACSVGTARTPRVPDSVGVFARLTNLDDKAPLDVVCVVEAEMSHTVCPFLREGDNVDALPCGTVRNRPTAIGAKKGASDLRDLVLDDTTFPAHANGWFGPVPAPAPLLPTPTPTPTPTPPVEAMAPESSWTCATTSLVVGTWWLPALLIRRRSAHSQPCTGSKPTNRLPPT